MLNRHSERRQPETLGNKNELARTETSNSGVKFPCRAEPISLAVKKAAHDKLKSEIAREMILHYAFGGCNRQWYKAW